MIRTESIPTYVFGISLIAIVAATIVSPGFRTDILAGNGETEIFGILSASGAVLVLLVAILVGGLILSARFLKSTLKSTVRNIKNDQDLFEAFSKAYPEASLGDLSVIEVPIGEDDLTIRYLRIPLFFVETFLLNR